MRKIKVIAVSLLFLFLLNTTIVLADDIDEEDYDQSAWDEIIQASAPITKEPILNSRAAVVIDKDTKKILYQKNADQKRPMASTTKIMTTLVVLEHAKLEDIVTISKKAANTGGSLLHIQTNDKVTVKDLLYGLMLRSGNDCAVALAEYVGGSIPEFADLMNQKAKELGLQNTHFVTPHGLDEDEHYTTAYELALLADYALTIPEFAQIVNTKVATISINGYSRQIANTNELLGYLDGVNGVKTGFTNNAGRCLVTSVTRNNQSILCVVLGADTKKQRTLDSIKLIEYVYANYQLVNIQEMVQKEYANWLQQKAPKITINKGKQEMVEVYLEVLPNPYLPIKKEQIESVQVEISNISSLEAPVFSNTILGNLRVKVQEEVLVNLLIRTKTTIEKKNMWDYLLEILGQVQEIKL